MLTAPGLSRVHSPNEVTAPQPWSRHPLSLHSHSVLGSQHRLPLLTRLIALSQSPGSIFDESIKTLCLVKRAQPVALLHGCCMFTFPELRPACLHWTIMSPSCHHHVSSSLMMGFISARIQHAAPIKCPELIGMLSHQQRFWRLKAGCHVLLNLLKCLMTSVFSLTFTEELW